jgi:group I intron endonuclease
MYGIIYCVRNKINGKRYVGQTVRTLSRRKLLHEKCEDSYPFHRALKKYGKQNFTWKILIKCKISELDKYEKRFIKKFKTRKQEYGYNLTLGGKGGDTYKHNPKLKKIKKKLGKSIKRYWNENYNKQVKYSLENLPSPSYIKKLWKNRQWRKKVLKNRKKKQKGINQKNSVIFKKKWKNKKYRKQMIKKLRLKWQDPKYRKKQKAILKKRWSNQLNRKRAARRVKKLWRNPVFRRKQRKAHRRRKK